MRCAEIAWWMARVVAMGQWGVAAMRARDAGYKTRAVLATSALPVLISYRFLHTPMRLQYYKAAIERYKVKGRVALVNQ